MVVSTYEVRWAWPFPRIGCVLKRECDSTITTEGFAILEEILSLAPETKVIVVTGQDDHENALLAVRKGAYDFYNKPIDSDTLALLVDRAYYLHELEEENRRLQRSQKHTPLQGLITAAPEMLKVCQFVEKVAPTDVTVLLLGERVVLARNYWRGQSMI